MRSFIVGLVMLTTWNVFALDYVCPKGQLILVQANVKRLVLKCKWKEGMPAFIKDIPYASAAYTQKNSKHILDLATAAKVNNRNVRIFLDSNSSTSPDGCRGHNCRRVIAIGMY